LSVVGGPSLTVEYQAAQTVLTGFLDRSAMYGVLSQFEMLGLGLVQVRRSPDPHAPVDDEVDTGHV
jgi:hypothetical protein